MNKFLDFGYKYCPDVLFPFFINLNRFIKNESLVNVDFDPFENYWVVHYPDYDLVCPSSRWIYSDIKSFTDKFENGFKINPGDVCVDVGACIGDTTLPMIIKTGVNGKVFAIEPVPNNLKFLHLNIDKYSNTQIIPLGVSDKKSVMVFYLHNTPTGHSLVPDVERKFGTMSINCDTLDNIFKNIRIDFCKVDVQGYEIKLLEGNKNFVSNVSKLVVETHDRFNPNLATYPSVINILEKLDCFGFINFSFGTGCVYAKI